MRQLLARIDEELHARLKERAAAEGSSLNSLVVSILRAATIEETTPAGVRDRARRTGRLQVPPRPSYVPSWAEITEATSGAGKAVSDALAAERATR